MSEVSPSPSPSAAAPPPPPVEVWRRFQEEPLSPDPPPPPRRADPDESRPLGPGTILGQWELLRRLGRGGMGEVFMAFYRPSRRRYALKVLGRDLHDDPVAVTRFDYEFWALSEVSHPAIVAPFCAGKDDGLRWYAMELLHGESLDRVSARGLLDPLRACRIGVQVADGLASMHAASIVHRDLKPGNIFLLEGEGDRVKLLDTGIAKLLPEFFADAEMRPVVEQRLQTHPDAFIGTPGYMAPEAVLGKTPAPAQDIYGLAVTLFRLMVGRFPYNEILPPGPGDEPRWSAELGRPIPRALEEVLRRALAVDPKLRQRSMSELRDQLEGVLEELEAEAAEEAAEGTCRVPPGDATPREIGSDAPTVIEGRGGEARESMKDASGSSAGVEDQRRDAIAIGPVVGPCEDEGDLPVPSTGADRPSGERPPPSGGAERSVPRDPQAERIASGRLSESRPLRTALVVAGVAASIVLAYLGGRVSATSDDVGGTLRWAQAIAAAVGQHTPPLPPPAVSAIESTPPIPEAVPDALEAPAIRPAASDDAATAVMSDQAALPIEPADPRSTAPPRRLGRSAFRKIVAPLQPDLDLCASAIPDDAAVSVEVRVRADGSVERVGLAPAVSFIAQRCVEKALGGLRFPGAEAPSTHTWPLRRP